ncbi:MAG: vanadium-dependent haloperoxidase [Agriterribacter sp.]
MVNNLYSISLSLTHADTVTIKFWADGIPGSLNVPAHATNILIQLVQLNKLNLEDAVIAYGKHSMAVSDAVISCFKTKYHYALIRPVSYIRREMGYADWNSIITTPSFPEYTAAHAVVSAASATIMESVFGKNYAFTDHTYDALYGPRSFASFDDYANDAGRSRVLGGLHYAPSVAAGLIQGRKVGERINQLFKAGAGNY